MVEEFLRNHYLKSFGYAKNRLDDARLSGKYSTSSKFSNSKEASEYEYYYYDEEAEPTTNHQTLQ